MLWYKSTLPEIMQELSTSDDGLESSQARRLLKRYGPNQLKLNKTPVWKVLVEPFQSIFVGILMVASLVSLLNNEQLEAIVIGIIIGINAVIFYTQHYATERVLRSLKKHSLQKVRVRRSGEVKQIESTDLVPGDIILLSEGEKVPADARITHLEHLQVDESSLTGESIPVDKHSSTLSAEKQVYEQDNMLFQGTYILSGSTEAVVVETGNRTEYGKIADLASETKEKSPVQAKIDAAIALLTKVIGLVAAVVFVLAVVRGIPAAEALRFVLSMTVSAVPEGLPVALTVVMVLGMRQMAKHKALVHSFRVMEDIGLVTAIATDKTGTLTKNHLEVVDSWSYNTEPVRKIAGKTIDPNKLADPLDRAIYDYSGKSNSKSANHFYDFDIGLRMSGAYSRQDKKIYIKGSPEHILNKSKLSKTEKKTAESKLYEFASNGYRVIAIAEHYNPVAPKDLSVIRHADLEFVGFLAFADELRPEAKKAIKEARAAGVEVSMITGDHFETAYTIGKQLGLAEKHDQIMTGADLPHNQAKLATSIGGKTIFARILPEDKFRILKALKTKHITAMTGDGVNDVPALSNANIGIAMGSGSDIAKDAGGMVLLNDNFATIIKALAEGRRIYDNIRRMLYYLLSTSLGEVLTMIGALMFNLPLPLVAIQILWINLVTDTVLVIPLGTEHPEKGLMQRPPRDAAEPLLSRVLMTRILLVGLTMAAVSVATVALLHQRGHTDSYIQTVTFMGLIVGQWANALNSRSQRSSVFAKLKINKGLLLGLFIAIGLQMLAMFGPLRSIVHVEAVPLATLGIVSLVNVLAVITVVEIHKFIRYKRRKNHNIL